MNKTACSLILAAGCGGGALDLDAFQAAVPSRDEVAIAFEAASAKRGTLSLAEVSPAYLALGDHVDEINGTIDDILWDLEDIATYEPEEEDESMRRWRLPLDEDPSLEEVLIVESDDLVEFAITYDIVDAGDQPGDAPILEGTVDDRDGSFDLALDLDAATEAEPEVDATGLIEIAAMPFDGGEREVWYDFYAVGPAGGPTEDSITTYWVFDDGSGGLEYLASYDDVEATVYARWDDDAGRLDQHAYGFDWDAIGTDCWDAGGEATFAATATFDESGDSEVSIDGDEADCGFGPLDGHPDPGEEFDDLPAEGEWDQL
jgi:hypothetical protein